MLAFLSKMTHDNFRVKLDAVVLIQHVKIISDWIILNVTGELFPVMINLAYFFLKRH